MHFTLSCSYTVKNLVLAPAGFAIKIRQNLALVGFGKSKSGTTLIIVRYQY